MHPFPGNRRAAVSVTYDDALPCHREIAAPALSARGQLGTFYCPAAAADLHDHLDAWRGVAAAGHELGNHSCWHPCRCSPGASWPDPAYDLRTYQHRRAVDEMVLADRVLHLVDGRKRRSFAATCGNLTTGLEGAEADFSADLRPIASVVRKGAAAIHPLAPPPFIAGQYSLDGGDLARAVNILEPLLAQGGWVILLIHGVGKGTHHLYLDESEHLRILDWIAARSDRLWSTTVTAVVDALTALPA